MWKNNILLVSVEITDWIFIGWPMNNGPPNSSKTRAFFFAFFGLVLRQTNLNWSSLWLKRLDWSNFAPKYVRKCKKSYYFATTKGPLFIGHPVYLSHQFYSFSFIIGNCPKCKTVICFWVWSQIQKFVMRGSKTYNQYQTVWCSNFEDNFSMEYMIHNI